MRYKKKNSRTIFHIILFAVLIISLGFLLFFSELFKVKHVQVSIDDLYLRKEAGNHLIASLGDNILFIDSNKIEEEILSKHPEIQELEIKKKMFSSLSINIKERKAAASICFEQCYLIDNTGSAFNDPDQEPDISIMIDYPAEIGLDIYVLEKILLINKETGINIFILKEQRLDAQTDEGWSVYFDLSKDISLAIFKLKLLLDEIEETKNLEYIDLRFSKAYYK